MRQREARWRGGWRCGKWRCGRVVAVQALNDISELGHRAGRQPSRRQRGEQRRGRAWRRRQGRRWRRRRSGRGGRRQRAQCGEAAAGAVAAHQIHRVAGEGLVQHSARERAAARAGARIVTPFARRGGQLAEQQHAEQDRRRLHRRRGVTEGPSPAAPKRGFGGRIRRDDCDCRGPCSQCRRLRQGLHSRALFCVALQLTLDGESDLSGKWHHCASVALARLRRHWGSALFVRARTAH